MPTPLSRLRPAALAVALAAVPALLAPTAAPAQSESGRASINGRVTDASGAIVPGATLTLKDNGTSLGRTLQADGKGEYSLPALAVGTYTLTVTAPGFAETRIENVLLSVGQSAEINIALMPAGSTTEIVVNASDEPDLTRRSETSNQSLISTEAVENLPTRGRNFTDFALLTPGITQELDRFGLVVNGQRSGNSNISIDGVDFNDPLQNGQRGGSQAAYFFPQVNVREFQVVRTGLTAEVGRTNAGFINVVTKSGTNHLHGEALYTNRNPFLTWPDALNDPEAANNQNQYAFGIGGPIVRDKLFFFTGIEKTAFEVPFFVRVGSNCPIGGFYDQNNLPGDAGCGQGSPNAGTNPLPAQFAALEVNASTFNSPLVAAARLDYQASPRNTVTLQYQASFLSNLAFGIEGNIQAAASNNTLYSQQSQSTVLGLTTALSSNRTNEVRLQWAYDNRQQVPTTSGPEYDISDFLNIGGNASGTYLYRAIREEALDNYSWLIGRNGLRFGVDINLEPETQQREPNVNGLWIIDTLQHYIDALPVAPGVGGQSPFAINAQSQPCGATVNACPFQFFQTLPYNNGALPKYIATQREFAGYFTDAFRVLPNLTLNLGFRYDAELEPAAPVNPAVPGTGVDPSDLTMFQPRLGVAWDPYKNGKTTLRGSVGLYDARTPGYLLQRNFTDNGALLANVNSNYDQNILNEVPALGSFASYGQVSTKNILNDIYVNNPAFRNPRSLQVAAAVDQQLTRRSAFLLSFTQQESWKLQHRLDTNLFQPHVDEATLYPIFPSINPITGAPCTFGTVAVPCRPNNTINGFHQNYSSSHSTYRSLIAQLRGSLNKKLSGAMNFTWASARDDDSNERDLNRELALDSLCTACYNRGYSKQDIRYNFNLYGVYRMPYRFIFSTSFIARTALPYTATTSGSKQGDFNNDGNTANDRPILCSQVAFTVCPVSATQVNAYKGGAETGYVVGRDTFRQAGFLNWDMRLIKEFRIHETQRLQFSSECLNCSRASNLNLGANEVSKFTHAQNVMNPLTGYYYSGNSAGKLIDAFDTFRSGGPRQIQLGARYLF